MQEGGFTDIYCQVYRRGRAWFPSILADDTPYRQALSKGLDPLKETIALAHSRGAKVHAWINTLRVSGNKQAPIFSVLGARAALVDNYGENLIDYRQEQIPQQEKSQSYYLGTPGVWLDAGSDSVRQVISSRQCAICCMLIQKLTACIWICCAFPFPCNSLLSNVILRLQCRHSILAMAVKCLARFFSAYGDYESEHFPQKVREQEEVKNSWDEWRRGQVNLLVFELRELLNEIAPGKELSVAVLADPSHAARRAFQDWESWLRAGIVDTVLPMSYTRDMDKA